MNNISVYITLIITIIAIAISSMLIGTAIGYQIWLSENIVKGAIIVEREIGDSLKKVGSEALLDTDDETL